MHITLERVGNGVIIRPYYGREQMLISASDIQVYNKVWDLTDFLREWFNQTDTSTCTQHEWRTYENKTFCVTCGASKNANDAND